LEAGVGIRGWFLAPLAAACLGFVRNFLCKTIKDYQVSLVVGGVMALRPAGGLSAARGTQCDVSRLPGEVVFLVDLTCLYGGSVCYKYGLSKG
jgi:hypothetical protein